MRRRVIAVAAVAASSVFAAPATVGVLTVKGTATVDQSMVRGNATLFEGSVVEATLPTQLKLNNGTTVGIDANSRAVVYGNRVVLERGTGAVRGGGKVEALGLRMTPETSGLALVSIRGGKVEVSPVEGAVSVSDFGGSQLARVSAGEALAFEPPADPQGASAGTQTEEEKKKKRRRGGAAAGGSGGAGGAGGAAGGAAAGAGMTAGAKAALALLLVGAAVGGGVGIHAAVSDDKSN